MTRNFYRASSAPYYIFALDYIQQSAGIRALHYLCHALNESGQEAYITCEHSAPQLRTPPLTADIMMRHRATGRAPVMVYPEIVSGDPLAAGGIVVRWLLNQPGHIGGDTSFPAGDLIFAYDPHFLLPGMHGDTLYIPTCDLAIFNNDNNPDDHQRDLVCFYAHKYLAAGGKLTKHVEGAVSLGKDQQLTHPQIAGMLRRSRLLYVYEPTSLVMEALLCGCPVAVIQTDYWHSNLANAAFAGDVGLVMDDSPESLAHAQAMVGNYRAMYENIELGKAWSQLDHFIELTQHTVRERFKPHAA